MIFLLGLPSFGPVLLFAIWPPSSSFEFWLFFKSFIEAWKGEGALVRPKGITKDS